MFVANRGSRCPTHPGKILRDIILDLDIPIIEVAKLLDITRQQLHRVIGCKSAISVEMALRIAKLLGSTPEFWLRMQMAHDLFKARQALRYDLEHIKPIKSNMSNLAA